MSTCRTTELRSQAQQADARLQAAARRSDRECGFSLTELLIVVTIALVIAAMAVPSTVTALKGYHLQADAANIASYANMARMKAASQYAPYRLNINVSNGTFSMEKLCGGTPSSVDASCGASPYAAFSTPDIDLGVQYAAQGDTYSSCRPAAASSYPGDITADPSGCPANLQIYFNTRGVPVDSSGNPLIDGGAVVYLTNQNNLTDAVTFALGGRVAVWNWNPSSSQWASR